MGNFAFLETEWPELFDEAARAEHLATADPRASCFYARRCLELALNWLYRADESLRTPYKNDLSGMIAEPSLLALAGPAIRTKMDVIRRVGNAAVHRTATVPVADSVRVTGELFQVMFWIAGRYARDPGHLPPTGLTFDTSLIPRPALARQQRQEELKRQADEFARQQAELAEARRRAEDLDAELAALRAAIRAAKKANEGRPDTHDYNEAETRTFVIDLLLREAGWDLADDEDREFPVDGLPESASRTGRGKVDYVLWDDDGKPLAVIEAKRATRDPQAGRHQAACYADALERRYGQRPVIFFTNGYETWMWDDVSYPPRQLQGFHTKEQLRLLIQRRAGRQALGGVPINSEIVNRHYQSRAIRRIGEVFTAGGREALLVMATGSGKTRTVIALVDQLSRAGWAKRVLFLADRTALVKQAANAFRAHAPGLPTVNLLTERNPDGRVMVSTYPTMMGLLGEMDGDRRRFGPGYFDLIVVDEAHRSVYQKYRAIFDYFDALLVGLTATPKDEIDRNTYRLFHLEDGVPTDSYTLEEAVADDYLVPPRTIDVPLKFQRRGIRYDELPDDEKEEWESLEWDDEGTVPDEISSEELNRFLFNSDTVDKALRTLMLHGVKVAGGDRLGKTIVFAKNQDHADFLLKRFDHCFPELKGRFAQVITHATAFSQSAIDEFSQHDRMPHVAISVDMLDTGIDVPEVVNLVFFKLVRSKTKFWQMIGRGTRLRPDLFGPGRDKRGFLVFDLCQNVEFFNAGLARGDGHVTPSLGERLFRRRADLLLALDRILEDVGQPPAEIPDEPATGEQLRWALVGRLNAEVRAMDPENILVRPHRRQVEQYSELAAWERMTPERHSEVSEHLAPLPSGFRGTDDSEEAKRFDLLALRLQLAVLDVEPGFGELRDQVREIADALLGQTTIPAVAAQQELLEELSGDQWWDDVTAPMLEAMRRRVRGLVRLIERTRRAVVYSHFTDEIGEISESRLQGVALGTDRGRFATKARIYLRSHEDDPVVRKLRHHRQIVAGDLESLTEVFLASGIGTREDIEAAAARHDGLGLFLRSLTGLDREAVREAFEPFRTGRGLTSGQERFLTMLVDFVAANGVVEAGQLYEPPFTAVAPGGPEDLFADADVDTLISVLDRIRATAMPV
ncbi:restriction endonuclease subunit R [Actinoplanes italicus]|uniref:Type I restriction enzyme R subunit n=1 Tax=Actinoplanes italicus TaxID=113567 RepID=A0A2T0KE58_9ACTN|nr:DEAD/DEAH box helicase family protein [Actinoplanes italicus]PRX21571.1 type I restriction enzyme R subunit [Actinoplanes italicus]GIE27249.1 restriction endonuclease subunit R [Actinoplanes italicus]